MAGPRSPISPADQAAQKRQVSSLVVHGVAKLLVQIGATQLADQPQRARPHDRRIVGQQAREIGVRVDAVDRAGGEARACGEPAMHRPEKPLTMPRKALRLAASRAPRSGRGSPPARPPPRRSPGRSLPGPGSRARARRPRTPRPPPGAAPAGQARSPSPARRRRAAHRCAPRPARRAGRGGERVVRRIDRGIAQQPEKGRFLGVLLDDMRDDAALAGAACMPGSGSVQLHRAALDLVDAGRAAEDDRRRAAGSCRRGSG